MVFRPFGRECEPRWVLFSFFFDRHGEIIDSSGPFWGKVLRSVLRFSRGSFGGIFVNLSGGGVDFEPRRGSFLGRFFYRPGVSVDSSGSFSGKLFDRSKGVVNPSGSFRARSLDRSGWVLNLSGSFWGKFLSRLGEVVHPRGSVRGRSFDGSGL